MTDPSALSMFSLPLRTQHLHRTQVQVRPQRNKGFLRVLSGLRGSKKVVTYVEIFPAA